jgi:hypothetical protein
MKISIWQQFSSNHSSSFTVVGEFETPEAALEASEKVRAALQKIADWYAQNPKSADDVWSHSAGLETPASPPEVEIGEQYGFEWKYAIEWMQYGKVTVFDRLVLVTPEERPDSGRQPIDVLMDKLGGKGYLEANIYGDDVAVLTFDLRCQTPDEPTAQEIYDTYLGFNRRIQPNGKHIHFYKWRFNEEPSLPELISELTKRGCSNIEYKLTQLERNPEDKDYFLLNFDKDDLPNMLDILRKGRDFSDRENAAEILGEIGDEQVVDVLISALKDPNYAVRRNVIISLGNLKPPTAVEPLIERLNDPDVGVRRLAVRALTEIGTLRAIEGIRQALLNSEESVRAIAETALNT